MLTLDDIVREVRILPIADRKRLIGLIVDTLTDQEPPPSSKRSILEFEGIAAHLADDEDPQDHVNRLRRE